MSELSVARLNAKINQVEEYYKKYPSNSNSVDSAIKRTKSKLKNQEYKIAVVANMSAGKSTFINALFGEEVLPAFNHATTDCATFIYSKPNIEKRAIIYFSDKKEKVEIKENLNVEIKEYAQKDEECEDDKYKNVEKIELFYPFINLQTSPSEDFSITFIDTPGPNSTGEGYKEKHKDQTRQVLNDVDLALFLFDYGQLDANLDGDEQGLWNTIKIRHDKDENFDVYFVLNKIDQAMDDNFKEIDTRDKEEYKKQKKENWYFHEKKAHEKLQNAAEAHDIVKPKIYTVSSKYQLLDRDENKSYDDDDELESFQKSHFKRVFDNKWQEKYIEYLGIPKLEKDINSYIDSSVKSKILKIVSDSILKIKQEEEDNLKQKIQMFEKPKEEAEDRLECANEFLEVESRQMQKDMENKFSKIESERIEEIDNSIVEAIKNEFSNEVERVSKKSIAYANSIAAGDNPSLASKTAKREYGNVNIDEEAVVMTISKEVDTNKILEKMQKYTQTLFEDCKRNYLDVKTELKDIYFKFEKDMNKEYLRNKTKLEEELSKTLDVKAKKIELQSIDYDSMLNFDIKVPSNVLEYNFQKAKYREESDATWWNPFSWFSTKMVKTQEEKHELVINPKDLKSAIEDNVNESISKFYEEEIKNHKKTITSYRSGYIQIFQEFRHDKSREIESIKEELSSSEENLKKVKNQLVDFEKITKEN